MLILAASLAAAFLDTFVETGRTAELDGPCCGGAGRGGVGLMSCLLGAGVVGGVTCLPAGLSLSGTDDLTVPCCEGPGCWGVNLTSCLLEAGVVGGVTCLLADPPVGWVLRRSLNGRPTVMPWSLHPVVE